MTSTEKPSFISIVGSNVSNCGYCHQKDTSYTFGIWAHGLTCADYQALIDRGWRRSGKYVYKPDQRKSCCPQYTIRLDTTKFKTTKSQRKILHKFNRYIDGEWHPASKDNMDMDKKSKSSSQPKQKGNEQTLIDMIHASEHKDNTKEHAFEIVLEPSSFTQEKYDLYCKYQQEIHHDDPSELSPKGFTRFLVDSPLDTEETDRDVTFGSFHQKYILDGTLIAVAILDILPHCVSSVYFMYDPSYSFLGLGNYSALREISLAQEYHTSLSDLKYYYMGYYIHTCEKMMYKAKYYPSDLLDPETYDWYSFNDVCKPLLDQHHYTSFASSSADVRTARPKSPVPPGWIDTDTIDDDQLDRVLVLAGRGRVVPVIMLVKFHDDPDYKEEIKNYVAAVGYELAYRMIVC